jgi:hypothetical protein
MSPFISAHSHECAAFFKREKVLLWRKKKGFARKRPSGPEEITFG